MNGSYVLDSNAVLYLLNGDVRMSKYLDADFYYSVITKLECLGYQNIKESESNKLSNFFSENVLCDLNNDVQNKTIQLRKKYKLKLPDAIIAATAIVNNLGLISADKHFENIEELVLISI